MRIKSTCVVYILALIVLVKCLLYRITESDPLTSHPTQMSSLQSREGTAMLCCHPAQAFASRQVSTVSPVWVSCIFSRQCDHQASTQKGGISAKLLKDRHDFFTALCQKTVFFGCNLTLNCPVLPKEGGLDEQKHPTPDRSENLHWKVRGCFVNDSCKRISSQNHYAFLGISVLHQI